MTVANSFSLYFVFLFLVTLTLTTESPGQSVESSHTARAGRQTMAMAGIEPPTT
jgi:hypothetical protein